MEKIVTNLSIQDYHNEAEHISASSLKYRSLAEYKYYKDHPEPWERKKHFDFGNAFELALLQPDVFPQQVAIKDEAKIMQYLAENRPELKSPRSSKEYQSWSAEFDMANAEEYIISATGAQSNEILQAMIVNCKADPVISKLLSQVELQYSCFWTDKETGMKLKCRPDVSKSGKMAILDVKTIDDGSPDSVAFAIKKFKYWLQAVMQIDGCIQAGLMDHVDTYLWLFVEKEPPFNVCLYEFAKADIEAKTKEYKDILVRLKKAQETNIYPGYQEQATDNKFGILTAKIW